MRALLVSLLLPTTALAHVGSPNVFFEGHAGPHAVRVVIRPPATLPGVAQVEVRTEGAASVAVQAAPWEARDETAAPPVQAAPVAGGAGLFHAPLWLLTRGSYRVRIELDGPRGRGAVEVPLHSAATQPPVMPPALAAALALAGLALLGLAVAIVRATVREGILPPRAGLLAGAALLAALGAGAMRWRVLDREFRDRALARPLPMEAAIRTAGTLRLLELAPGEDMPPEARWDSLVTDHGKLMHLFLVREPDAAAFAHLHPVRRDAGRFESVLPPLPAGDYQLYAETTQESGLAHTLTARLALPAPSGPELPPMADWKMVNEVWCQSPTVPRGNASQPFALDADDSWHAGPEPAARVSPLMGGGRMIFHHAGELVADRETTLRFTVVDAAGRQAALQPYMGMLGHAVLRRADGAVFTHLHPVGTVSMAAQEMLASRRRESAPMPVVAGDEVSFPYAFPRAGEYRLWVQVRIGGRVLTGTFAVPVRVSPR